MPLTIQAFTGDTLSKLNITTFNDLLQFTPNVTFGSNGPRSGGDLPARPVDGFRRQSVVGDDRLLPERRPLSRRPVDAVPGAQC